MPKKTKRKPSKQTLKYKFPSGKLLPAMGFSKGNALLTLMRVSECKDITCPIRDDCEYAGKGRCKVEQNLLSNLFNQWVDDKNGIGDMLNQIHFNRIGTRLLPLYQQLARLYREITALPGTFYTDDKYIQREYPQLKAFREVSETIDRMEKELGLAKLWEQKFGKKVRMSEQGLDEVYDHGMVGSYEEMAAMDEESEEEAADPHELAEKKNKGE